MAKTYADILTEARELLQDTDSDLQRYTDSTLFNILNRGLQDVGRMRPDAFYDLYDASSLNIPEIIPAGGTPGAGQVVASATFGIDMMFFAPLVAYVTGVAEVTDDEYTVDGRAALLLNQFRMSVIGL